MDAPDTTTNAKDNQIQALDALWTKAENHLKAATLYARRTVEEAWLAGDALTRIKTRLPHGTWLPELKERGIPERTAQRFVKLRRRYPEMRQIVAFNSVSAALSDKLLEAVEPTARQTIDPDPEPPAPQTGAAAPATAQTIKTEPEPPAAQTTQAKPEPPAETTIDAAAGTARPARPALPIRPRPKRLADKRLPYRKRPPPQPKKHALVTLSANRNRRIGASLQLAGRRLGGSVWSHWSGRGGILVLRMSWPPTPKT